MAETKRVSGFTQPEKLYLINLISRKYWKILEDQIAHRTSLDEKKEAWKDIEQVFNASGPMVEYRNADSLKRLYENKKKELRKKLGKTNKRLLAGEGTMPTNILDDSDKILMSILNDKCLTTLQNNYDCDNEDHQENQSNTEIIDMQKIGNKKHALEEQNIDGISAKIDNGTPGCKKFKSDNLKLTLNSPNTSDIYEKYNVLLDRRMMLLEKQLEQMKENAKFQEEEHKLKVELLNIEIQNKKFILNNLDSAF